MAIGPVVANAVAKAKETYPYFTEGMLGVRNRTVRITKPRHYTWYLLRIEGYSLTWIGRNTGRWHHTTVLHGLKLHLDRMAREKNYPMKHVDVLQNIQDLMAKIAVKDMQISELTKERYALVYRLNDLKEKAYAERPSGADD
jgi:chromosomal replication initiation ATPase DnaA